MSKPRILLQFDPDPHPSPFDAVVALDAGVDHVLQYASVEPADVRDLVHGAIFTRGPQDLKQTAIFVGGSDVTRSQSLFKQIETNFVGPLRVSVLFDASGANTTAAAAVLTASRCVDLATARAVVLAATGPVGQRAVHLLARAGTQVHVASRNIERARSVCQAVAREVPHARLIPSCSATVQQTSELLADANMVIAAGAAGCELLPYDAWQGLGQLQVAIDLNAVPPAGIGGIEPVDSGRQQDGVLCHGAIGIGRLKMKIHKAAVRQLYESNDQLLDFQQVYEIGRGLLDVA